MARKSGKGEISEDIRRQHIEGWRQAKALGLDRDSYCEQQGITRNQLAYWLKMSVTEGTVRRKGGAFARVEAAKVVPTPMKSAAARLVVAGGACLELDGSVDPVWAARLIAAMGGRP